MLLCSAAVEFVCLADQFSFHQRVSSDLWSVRPGNLMLKGRRVLKGLRTRTWFIHTCWSTHAFASQARPATAYQLGKRGGWAHQQQQRC